MTTAERTTEWPRGALVVRESTAAFHSSKVGPEHLEKLAIVYVRQSSPQQVFEHRESGERQYGLVELARALGWPADRILVIDDDQGQSGQGAEHRSGFQRLMAEVTMDHIGLVIGLDMSRLARSSKDWHQLFELCGIFGALLADEDGVYDANDPTDRMILGLKGIMSELELHTMRNRLHRGAMNKARRGELFHSVATGYVILPSGEVVMDPDEQVRGVIQQIFDKFDEVGSVFRTFHWFARQHIALPLRCRCGSKKGELEWRCPTMTRILDVLHNPIYAGTYAYGRSEYDRKSRYRSPKGKEKRRVKPLEEWTVLIKDRLPAYITWNQFLKNQERMRENQQKSGARGVARHGSALLTTVLVCGHCHWKMNIKYAAGDVGQYVCESYLTHGTAQTCTSLTSLQIDRLVTQQVLTALAPAALELSLQTLADLERERGRLDQHWQQRLKRAQYEIDLAERRYRAVDPDNRLVAATLEKHWEQTLRDRRQIQDEYDRFHHAVPAQITPDERSRIMALSSDIPALWHAESTTNADRKEIIRCLIDRVVVHVRSDSQYVDATIHWHGGYVSQHEFIRCVYAYVQLSDLDSLMQRVGELRQEGATCPEIADRLNAEGFVPPRRHRGFTAMMVSRLLTRGNLMGRERWHDELLGADEWWLADLAKRLNMPHRKLRDWAIGGWVRSRQTPIQGYWIAWADDDELARLRRLAAESRSGKSGYSAELITPKTRP